MEHNKIMSNINEIADDLRECATTTDPVTEVLNYHKELQHGIHQMIIEIRNKCERYMVPEYPPNQTNDTPVAESETPLITELSNLNLEAECILNYLRDIRNRLV